MALLKPVKHLINFSICKGAKLLGKMLQVFIGISMSFYISKIVLNETKNYKINRSIRMQHCLNHISIISVKIYEIHFTLCLTPEIYPTHLVRCLMVNGLFGFYRAKPSGRPYTEGFPCTLCPSGYSCQNGLCV